MISEFAARDFAHRIGAVPPDASVGLVTRLLAILFAWHERIRQRRQLYALDDRMLKDIGLTRVDVEREASKHFWVR
jgi:uncharacterized protein YjiS (DUF1127 family)